MGSFFSLFGKSEARIVMVGLDAAGKTTLLYKLKLNEVVTTIPTIGFNVEKVEYKNINMTIMDVDLRTVPRGLWRAYLDHASGVIFVVDSCDESRMAIAADELEKVMSEPPLALAQVALVVFANKQDSQNALSICEVADRLNLCQFKTQCWLLQGTSAATGAGLYEGLNWLRANMRKNSRTLSQCIV